MFLINAAMEKISIGTAALIVVLGMAVVFFGLILLMCVTKIAGAIISRKKAAEPAAAPAATPVAPAAKNAPAPGSAGKIALHDVPDKTAAMLMAIVADKTGKPSTSFASSLSARSRTNSCFYIINSRKRVYALPAFIFLMPGQADKRPRHWQRRRSENRRRGA